MGSLKLDRATGAALAMLIMLFILAGGAALRESVTVDEGAHIGAGLSYWQKLDLRLNPEHPPLGKLIAALPLAISGTRADYNGNAWKLAESFFPAYMTQFIFGDAVLGRWNGWEPTLMLARLPMLILTLLLGWTVYIYARRFGGAWGGLLCLAAYVTTPAILVFGPLVITDLPVTLFCLAALWQLGEIWTEPSRKNALLLGLALAAAVLSKFTGLLLFLVMIALFVQTRFWPTAEEPRDKLERRTWRKARRRAVGRGVLWALLMVYIVYLCFSLHQPDSALYRVGNGAWAGLVRRPLMPVWLYVRGLLLMLLTGSRATFLLGRSYSRGVPFYFPVVFALKSTLGFLLLLVLAAAAAIASRPFRREQNGIVPPPFRPHWRVMTIGFFVFLSACLLSQLDISIRHFMMPVVLLILMLAPLPNMIDLMPRRQFWQGAAALFAVSSFGAVLGAFPYFFPFVNSLSMGRPVYFLVNDSNVTWNESLPAVENFVKEHGLANVNLDWASLADPALVVPQAQAWDCQTPTDRDAGQWVFVTAVSILENHNCGYVLQYPHQALAGGASYAVKLPQRIPPAGSPGGPPLASERRVMWFLPFDMRTWMIQRERDPGTLPDAVQTLMRNFQQGSATSRKK